MNKSTQIIWQLVWFEKKGDSLVGECNLKNLSLGQLQKLFHRQYHDPMPDCYPVKYYQVEFLQNFVDEKIDLEKYDYFVESYSK